MICSVKTCFVIVGLVWLVDVEASAPSNPLQSHPPPVVISDYPYFAAIEAYGDYVCAATVIDDLYVIATNSCAGVYDVNHLSVRVGTDRLGWRGAVYKVTEVTATPKTDLAMVKVAAFITFDPKVIPLNPNNDGIKENQTAVVAAWSDKKYGSPLTVVPVTVLTSAVCSSLYQGVMNISRDMSCLVSSQPTTPNCFIDKGAPMYFNEQLYGVVTYSPNCSVNLPVVVTAIAPHTSFVVQTLVDFSLGF